MENICKGDGHDHGQHEAWPWCMHACSPSSLPPSFRLSLISLPRLPPSLPPSPCETSPARMAKVTIVVIIISIVIVVVVVVVVGSRRVRYSSGCYVCESNQISNSLMKKKLTGGIWEGGKGARLAEKGPDGRRESSEKRAIADARSSTTGGTAVAPESTRGCRT